MNDVEYYKQTIKNYFGKTASPKRDQEQVVKRRQSARVQFPKEIFTNNNYIQIKSHELKTFQRDLKHQKNFLKLAKKEEKSLLIKKQVLNDYIDMVNKRKVLVDEIKTQGSEIQQIGFETSQYFTKYYSQDSFFKQKLEQLLEDLRPENQHVKKTCKYNGKKIEYLLEKYQNTSPEHFEQKQKRKSTFQTEKDRLLKVSKIVNEEARKAAFSSKQKEKNDYLETLIDRSDKVKVLKLRKIKERLMNQELKYGNEKLKLDIYNKGVRLIEKSRSIHSSNSTDLNKQRKSMSEITPAKSVFFQASPKHSHHDVKKKARITSIFDSSKSLKQLLVPHHYQYSSSSLGVSYKKIQEDCYYSNVDNERTMKKLMKEIKRSKKGYRKLSQSHQKLASLRNYDTLRELVGPGYPLKGSANAIQV